MVATVALSNSDELIGWFERWAHNAIWCNIVGHGAVGLGSDMWIRDIGGSRSE
jgi:hypothetical protein